MDLMHLGSMAKAKDIPYFILKRGGGSRVEVNPLTEPSISKMKKRLLADWHHSTEQKFKTTVQSKISKPPPF